MKTDELESKDKKRKGIYYDVGDEKAREVADAMIKSFGDKEKRGSAGED